MSHIFKLSDTAFFPDPPFVGILVYLAPAYSVSQQFCDVSVIDILFQISNYCRFLFVNVHHEMIVINSVNFAVDNVTRETERTLHGNCEVGMQ